MTHHQSGPDAAPDQHNLRADERVAGPDTPRGIRLNNPGNIRHSKDDWQGKSADQPDRSFVKFDLPIYGIRAMVRILLNYERKGFDTIREVITRWAPPAENDTGSYVSHVASLVGVDADELIDLDRFDIMLPLVKAIIRHENGEQPYSDRILTEGLRLGGVYDAPREKPKIAGKVITGASVGLGLVSQAVEPARTVSDSLAAFTGAPIIQNVVTIALTIAGLATLAGIAKTYLDHKKGL